MSSIFSVPELAVGVGLSEAASAAFEPKVEVPKQSAWANNPQRLPDVGLIAALVAGGKVSQTDGRNMARRLGFDAGPFDSLTWIAQNRLDFPLMLRLWRRFGAFSAGDDAALAKLVDETLAHEQLDWDYHPWLTRLKTAELVGLGDIAMGIVRSALPAPSYVPVPAPTTGLSVPRFPQVNIDPEQLAAALGFSKEMLQLMVARSGLSLAPGLAAQALFRGLINHQDFRLAIAEGDLRTEWADTLRDAVRAIPTPSNFVQHHLRGWSSQQAMYDGAARHGTSQPDTDVLYQIERRPLAPHAITTGLARGGTFNPQPGEIQDPYQASVHQADLGPEWYSLAEANKYLYPSAFVLRSLAQAGDLGNQAAVEQVLLEIGWKPSFAQKVSTSWTTAGAGGDSHVAKAHNTAWTKAQASYIARESTAADVQPIFTLLGIPAGAQTEITHTWDAVRALVRKQLSPASIRKELNKGVVNLATGQPWTMQEAIDALLARGYDLADATGYLQE